MNHKNKYHLTLKHELIVEDILECENCKITYEKGEFCTECGLPLSKINHTINKSNDIIHKLCNSNENITYLLNDNGSVLFTSNKHKLLNNIIQISNVYNTVLFILDYIPDDVFNKLPNRIYIMNGKQQKAKITLTYSKFDKNKLI